MKTACFHRAARLRPLLFRKGKAMARQRSILCGIVSGLITLTYSMSRALSVGDRVMATGRYIGVQHELILI